MAFSTVNIASDDVSALVQATNQVASQLSGLFTTSAVFSGVAQVAGATRLSSTLTATSAVVFSSTLTVTSLAHFSAGVSIAGSLVVTGTFAGTIASAGFAQSATSAQFAGSAAGGTAAFTLSSTLAVASGITASSTLTLASLATLSGPLQVTGSIVGSGTLRVTSGITGSATLQIADSAVISGTAYVYGSMTVIGTLSATLSGVAASAQFATSAGHAQSATSAGHAVSALSALFATSAGFAQSATSAAFAQSAMSAAFAVSHQFHGILLTLGSVQAVGNDATTALRYISVIYDTASFYTATASSRITISTGVSRVRLHGNVFFPASGIAGYCRCNIVKNSANFVGMPFVAVTTLSTAAVNTSVNLATIPVSVTSGDFFEVVVRHTIGGTVSFQVIETQWFGMEVVQ